MSNYSSAEKAKYIRMQLESRGFMLTDNVEFCIKVALEDMEIGNPERECPACRGFGYTGPTLNDPDCEVCNMCDGTGDCLHKNTRPFGEESNICNNCNKILYAGHRYI